MSLDYEGLELLAMFTATIGVCSHYSRTPPSQMHNVPLHMHDPPSWKQAANQNIAAAGSTDPFRNSAEVEWFVVRQQQADEASFHVKNFLFFSRDSAARSQIASGDFKHSHSNFCFVLGGEQAQFISFGILQPAPLGSSKGSEMICSAPLSKADKMFVYKYVCMYDRCEGRKMRVRWSCFMFIQTKGEKGFAGIWDSYPASVPWIRVRYKTRYEVNIWVYGMMGSFDPWCPKPFPTSYLYSTLTFNYSSFFKLVMDLLCSRLAWENAPLFNSDQCVTSAVHRVSYIQT